MVLNALVDRNPWIGYLAFAKGNMSPEQSHILWKNLSEYCKLDTYAMVELLEMFKKI